MEVITKQDFEEWQKSDVTKAFYKALFNEREALKEQIVNSNFYGEAEQEAKGRCAAAKTILEMSFEDLMESLQNG